MRDIRIVFMGTPDFAVTILKNLIAANYIIAGVITAPDNLQVEEEKYINPLLKNMLYHKTPHFTTYKSKK